MAVDHFPTRQQAVIWRNWKRVPVERLARVLGATRRQIEDLAEGLGLPSDARPEREWLTRGYCSLIRDNWHLLSYRQLLILLGWTPERMLSALHEDDFLWVKLGGSKPNTGDVCYAPLTEEQERGTRRLRQDLACNEPSGSRGRKEAPFSFMHRWSGASPSRLAGGAKGRGRQYDPRAPLRLAYSYIAACGDVLLDSGHDPYPDRLLEEYAAAGINAVWLHGLLSSFFPWDRFPDLSIGWEKRLLNLCRLVRRAARHGIGVYLYLNEPRGLPEDRFVGNEDLKGTRFVDSELIGFCTSNPEVRAFLRGASEHLFRRVPGLAGVFTITMSENPTNCFSRAFVGNGCPKCGKHGGAAIVAGVNRLIAEGVHAAAPSARVIAWTWGWKSEWALDAIDLLPVDVDVMCVSEWGLPTRVGGISGTVIDYSISQVGPSEMSVQLWRRAQARGLRTVAKIQMNNSWENCAVPWLPVPDLVERHVKHLGCEGVRDLMVGWTLGGYPGGNLALLDSNVMEIAARDFGDAAEDVRRAWSSFSRAFAKFPFSCDTIYYSPINRGPANLLHLHPSGLRASMVAGFPYDDISTWRSVYPEEVFIRQLKMVSDGWRRGLRQLTLASVGRGGRRLRLAELTRIAMVSYCHFRSAYLQSLFIFVRDRLSAGPARNARMRSILRGELALTRTLLTAISQDSRIGFEAANHYLYDESALREKIIQCNWMLRCLSSDKVAS